VAVRVVKRVDSRKSKGKRKRKTEAVRKTSVSRCAALKFREKAA
jgi:ACT domain-containing protein